MVRRDTCFHCSADPGSVWRDAAGRPNRLHLFELKMVFQKDGVHGKENENPLGSLFAVSSLFTRDG